MADERGLNEHEWNLVVQCAAEKNEAFAKGHGPAFYKAYLETVKQMEDRERAGIKCTYDVGYNM